MQILRWFVIVFLLGSSAAYPNAGSFVATDNVKARLVSEVNSIAPGESIWVALELEIRDGWHTYWRNPGDSGQATKLAWTMPLGFSAGDILWTTPQRIELPPLVNYGYAKHAVHLVKITAPKDLAADAHVTLAAKASWLVCSDVCVPEDANLQIDLPVGKNAGALDPGQAPLFAAARAALPNPQPFATTARVQNGELLLNLGQAWGDTLSRIEALEFFPYDEGGIEYAAPQTLRRSKDSLTLAMKLGYQPPQAATLKGVLIATQRSGNELMRVSMDIAAPTTGSTPAITGMTLATTGVTKASASRAEPGAPSALVRAPSATLALPSLILLAVLGGMILNLMPCVFPVLSIKAIGLVEQAKKHPAAVRAKGMVFAAGVITSMLSLAGVLLALRAGGQQIGWGFQLQSPLFVTLMIYLLFAVGLNLSGVFEVGGGLAGVGDGLTQGDSYRAAFFTGVLTTLVATPCTAPFMAAAVGAALTQSSLVALFIFAALGLGLSLPYLLLSFAPWVRRALPKPGAWMDTLKQLFAFPMYASAAWLLWVLAQQTSSVGLGAGLAGAILIALAAWSYQRSKASSTGTRLIALAAAAASLLLAIFLPVQFGGTAAAHDAVGTAASSKDAWRPYDASKVADIKSSGKPLLINFTASWCLTCLVNERNAFADEAVQAIFRSKEVALMKGDWTNRDPAITSALTSFGRAGVPLYVVYNAKPGSTEPLVLPQLLTATVVRAAFADLPDRGLK